MGNEWSYSRGNRTESSVSPPSGGRRYPASGWWGVSWSRGVIGTPLTRLYGRFGQELAQRLPNRLPTDVLPNGEGNGPANRDSALSASLDFSRLLRLAVQVKRFPESRGASTGDIPSSERFTDSGPPPGQTPPRTSGGVWV